MRADADRAVALADLDLEAQLAAVYNVDKAGVDRAPRAVDRRGDVLDADLKPDRGLAVGEVLGGEQGGVALHHGDHGRRRQDRRLELSTDVGQQAVLDDEGVRALAHHIDRPPETPSVWPVT